MKILFIGGTGRLSKDVAKQSLQGDNEVYLLTRGSADRNIFVDSRYNMIYADINNKEDCREKLKGLYFDVVIDFLSYNQKQLKNTLEIIKDYYKQYIFISTATVYKKKNDSEIISENSTEVGNDLWSYSYDKYNCEKFLDKYFANKDEVYTIIRPYVTYSNTRVPYPIVPGENNKEWSLINRIKQGKPIPVFNNGNTQTTLTNTRDFAVGTVGLFMNEKAFGEAFHITSDENVTWGMVLDILANIYSIEIKKINISVDQISKSYPFYRDILLGDKGKNMRFDNRKISSVVPEYECNVSLKDGLQEVVDFYENHKEYQKIDYYWDGRIDRMCKPYYKNIPKQSFPNIKARLQYMSGRYKILSISRDIIVKVKNKIH